jgi:hypothetical protein
MWIAESLKDIDILVEQSQREGRKQSYHWKKTKLGWPHPSIYQMQPSEENLVLANQGNP